MNCRKEQGYQEGARELPSRGGRKDGKDALMPEGAATQRALAPRSGVGCGVLGELPVLGVLRGAGYEKAEMRVSRSSPSKCSWALSVVGRRNRQWRRHRVG